MSCSVITREVNFLDERLNAEKFSGKMRDLFIKPNTADFLAQMVLSLNRDMKMFSK